MATKARQQYFADEISLQKQRREFSLEDSIKQKIDSVEAGAQVNTIETVKVNGTALTPDVNKAVNVLVPDVIDNLYSTSTDDALSAKQGKVLYDYIQNIASRGRFLSNWNCATGLPVTNPTTSPYTYMAGDYYSISNVASGGGTNYRPDGSSYTIGQASTTTETEEVNVSDFYLYDGTNWLLLVNTARQIAVDSSLSTMSTNPVENRVVTNAINAKVGVSADNGNYLSDGAKIWLGTETDFNSIVSPDTNTMYIQYVSSAPSPTPGWQPGVNTIAYWKLNGNYNDEMGNFNGASSHSGNGWATLPGSSDQYLTVNMTGSGDRFAFTISNNLWSAIASTQNDLTFNRWRYFDSQYSGTNNYDVFLILGSGSWEVIRVGYGGEFNSGNGGVYLGTGNGGYNYNGYITTISTSTWHNMIFTYNKTTRVKSYYVDGTLIGTTTSSLDYNTGTGQNFANIFGCNGSSSLVGGGSNFIIENKERTAQEISDYYDQTKANYGIS